jgi:hypothetical protein
VKKRQQNRQPGQVRLGVMRIFIKLSGKVCGNYFEQGKAGNDNVLSHAKALGFLLFSEKMEQAFSFLEIWSMRNRCRMAGIKLLSHPLAWLHFGSGGSYSSNQWSN